MSKGKLLITVTPSKPAKQEKKPKAAFSKGRIDVIRNEFNKSRYNFFKLKINEIRKNIYEIEKNKKNLLKIKDIERNLTELDEKTFSNKKVL